MYIKFSLIVLSMQNNEPFFNENYLYYIMNLNIEIDLVSLLLIISKNVTF